MAKAARIDVSQKDAVVVEHIDYFVKKDCFKDKTIIDYTFNNCTFKGVNFAGAKLYMCTFNNCTFERCNFNNAEFRHSDFTTAIFKGCIHWHKANLEFAQFNEQFKQELVNLVFQKVIFKR